MKKEEKIYDLLQLLQERPADIKAEVLLNHALENGFPEQSHVVRNSGFFYREFVKDIFLFLVLIFPIVIPNVLYLVLVLPLVDLTIYFLILKAYNINYIRKII